MDIREFHFANYLSFSLFDFLGCVDLLVQPVASFTHRDCELLLDLSVPSFEPTLLPPTNADPFWKFKAPEYMMNIAFSFGTQERILRHHFPCAVKIGPSPDIFSKFMKRARKDIDCVLMRAIAAAKWFSRAGTNAMPTTTPFMLCLQFLIDIPDWQQKDCRPSDFTQMLQLAHDRDIWLTRLFLLRIFNHAQLFESKHIAHSSEEYRVFLNLAEDRPQWIAQKSKKRRLGVSCFSC